MEAEMSGEAFCPMSGVPISPSFDFRVAALPASIHLATEGGSICYGTAGRDADEHLHELRPMPGSLFVTSREEIEQRFAAASVAELQNRVQTSLWFTIFSVMAAIAGKNSRDC